MRIHIKLFFPLILCCACHHQDTEISQLSTPYSLTNTSQEAISTGYFTQGDWPSITWWDLFEDPQLSALIEEGLQKNPTLKRAQALVEKAEAEAKKIRSKLFPNLSAGVVDDWEYYSKYGFIRDFFPSTEGMEIPHKMNEIDLSLQFSYEFDFWGKNKKAFAAAFGLAKAERIEQSQTQLTIATAIAYAYFTWQTHRLQYNLYSAWKNHEETLQMLSAERSEVGIDNVTPNLQTHVSLSQIEQKIFDLEKEIAIDKFVIKNLLGKGPDDDLLLDSAPLPASCSIQIPENLGIDLLSRRPDLMAQIWRVEAMHEQVGVAKTEFYPNINLNAFAGFSSLTFQHLFLWDSRQGALRPAIHLPLFTGGRLEANLSEKKAELHEAIYTYNSLLLDAVKEVASEIATYLSLERQLQSQERLCNAQQAILEVEQSRYAAGVDNLLMVIPKEEKVSEVQIAAIELQQYRLLSLVRLIKSLGGGFYAESPPLERVSYGK